MTYKARNFEFRQIHESSFFRQRNRPSVKKDSFFTDSQSHAALGLNSTVEFSTEFPTDFLELCYSASFSLSSGSWNEGADSFTFVHRRQGYGSFLSVEFLDFRCRFFNTSKLFCFIFVCCCDLYVKAMTEEEEFDLQVRILLMAFCTCIVAFGCVFYNQDRVCHNPITVNFHFNA